MVYHFVETAYGMPFSTYGVKNPMAWRGTLEMLGDERTDKRGLRSVKWLKQRTEKW
jgi:hypothetical protein